MRAEVAGVQVEGTPEELVGFLRLYSQPEARSDRLACDICGKTYGSRDSLGAHGRRVHGVHKKRQRRASKLKDAPDPNPKLDKLEKVVLSRLYDLPAQNPERAQRGKTALAIARELGETPRGKLPAVLKGLLNKGYAIEFPNPFDPPNPMYFRKPIPEELAVKN